MTASQTGRAVSQTRLKLEFLLLYLAAPLAVALFLDPRQMFPALFAVTGLGLILLHVTDGFHWRDLRAGWLHIDWGLVRKFTVLTFLLCLGIVLIFEPSAFGMPGREYPLLLLMIVVLYPLLSALPQEIVFRVLYYRRYASFLPRGHLGLLLNAGLFSLAHLMYWNVIVALMTFIGGIIFATAYEMRKSFPLAVILHAIAGNLIFALGLGVYFYSGNVVRPF